MTVGKFNILDVAKVKISVNGISQTIDLTGPTKLKAVKDEIENNSKRDEDTRAREILGRERFSKGVGPE
jgi:hypothetical protein